MPFVLVDKPQPDIAVVTMNRPERMNAMAFDVMIPLREALETLSHDNDVRVVVLTGAGHGLLLGRRPRGRGHRPNIDGLTVTSIARRALELLDDVILADPQDAPARDRRDQRRRDRRRLLPGVRVRPPRRVRRARTSAPPGSTTA